MNKEEEEEEEKKIHTKRIKRYEVKKLRENQKNRN